MSSPTGPGSSLARVLRRGAGFAAVGLVVSQALALVQTLALARLLGPAVLGSFAAGTALIGVLQLVGEGGLRQALIQHGDEGLDAAADTVFWATLASGVAVAALTAAGAPLVAAYFDDPVAGTVAVAVAGVPSMS